VLLGPLVKIHVPPLSSPRWTWLILGIWLFALFAAFQPGLMSSDSLGMYDQGIRGSYGNWHPPFMSWLLGLTGKVAGSPWPFFLAQLFLLGLGFARALEPSRSRWPGASLLFFSLILLLPPVWATAVTIWKDVAMATAMLWAVVFLKEGKPWRAFLALTFCVLFRHNGIFAAVPLLPCVTAGFRRLAHSWRRRFIVGLSLLLVLLGAPRAFDRIVRAHDEGIIVELWVFDLAGIYTRVPALFSGSVLERYTTLSDVRKMYTPLEADPLMWGTPHLPMDQLQGVRGQLGRDWIRAILHVPRSYLAHRMVHLRALLSIPPYTAANQFHEGIDANSFGFTLAASGFCRRVLVQLREGFRNTLFFRGWTWVATCVFWLLALARSPSSALARWVLLSGIAYALGYAAVSVCDDFRYLYWTVIALLASGALSWPRRMRLEVAGLSGQSSIGSETGASAPQTPAAA
jgi:hypothetical protein